MLVIRRLIYELVLIACTRNFENKTKNSKILLLVSHRSIRESERSLIFERSFSFTPRSSLATPLTAKSDYSSSEMSESDSHKFSSVCRVVIHICKVGKKRGCIGTFFEAIVLSTFGIFFIHSRSLTSKMLRKVYFLLSKIWEKF